MELGTIKIKHLKGVLRNRKQRALFKIRWKNAIRKNKYALILNSLKPKIVGMKGVKVETKVLFGYYQKPIHVDDFGGVQKEIRFFHKQCHELNN